MLVGIKKANSTQSNKVNPFPRAPILKVSNLKKIAPEQLLNYLKLFIKHLYNIYILEL
jgi:hypothetical protein